MQLASGRVERPCDARIEVLSQPTAATLLRFETATGVPLVSVYVGIKSHAGYRNSAPDRVATGQSRRG